MERELVHLFEAARKPAVLDGPEVSGCVDALNQLKAFPRLPRVKINGTTGAVEVDKTSRQFNKARQS
ncbi:hypothetical protein V6N12_027518 [Hibiscus sabdariffa]|uniref:Uncharacterized protein n=1 Tax=Hibiscus sabdariffa TaxID=183260 RepID=A0ABR2F355_9ROSI